MNHLLALRLTPGYVLMATCFGLAGWVAVMIAGASPWQVAATVVAVMLLVVLSVRGSTIPEWVRRTRQVKTRHSPVDLASRDGAAIGWDANSRAALVWVGIQPAGPFTVTTVHPDGTTTSPTVDLGTLAEMMIQDDIVCSRLQVTTTGMRYAVNSTANRLITQMVGQLPTHASGTTILELTMRMEDSHAAAAARATHGSHVIGMQKAILAAASRIVIRLRDAGLGAWIMGPGAVRTHSGFMIDYLGEASDAPRWKKLGGVRDVPAVITAAPSPGKFTTSAQRRWLDAVRAWRTVENVVLEKGRDGAAQVAYTATFISADDDHDIPDLHRQDVGLTRLGGQQVQAASRLIPIAGAKDLDVPWARLDPGAPPVAVHPAGLGVFMGHGTAGKVFMRVDGNSAAVLWVVGSLLLARQFLLRLSATPVSVDIRLPDSDGAWQRFVDHLDSPLVTVNQNPNAEVVVTGEGRRGGDVAGRTVIVVAEQVPEPAPAYCVVATGDSQLAIINGADTTMVPWELGDGERRLITITD